MNNEYLKLGLVVAVVGALFAFAWRKGYLRRMTNYTQEVQQELKKCTWPTREELRGSTVVVVVAFTLLASFTMAVDQVLMRLIRSML